MTSIDLNPSPLVDQAAARPDPPDAVMPARNALVRLNDYYEVYSPADPETARAEGGRCMNCGAAFCMPDSGYGPAGNIGCPLGNKIPEWNELVHLGRWRDAFKRLSQTNPFPEFTARVCPAPCEDACIHGINEQPVQIKGIERAIIDRAFQEGWVTPSRSAPAEAPHIGIVGSGPAGLSAAQELTRMRYRVTVYERDDKPGGLLRYGVPNMKLDKQILDRRIKLIQDSGVVFRVGCEIGRDITADELRAQHSAIILACGAKHARDLRLPGRGLRGIHQAMDYLTDSMRALDAGTPPRINAKGKRVAVIGAGDTGADCVATALRQGAADIINLANGPMPPDERAPGFHWPGPTGSLRTDYAHRESIAIRGQDPRHWRANTLAFEPSEAEPDTVGYLAIQNGEAKPQQIAVDLVILSVGFTGHNMQHLVDQFEQADVACPVFIAGDMARGPSLVVHAIAEGRQAAQTVHTVAKDLD